MSEQTHSPAADSSVQEWEFLNLLHFLSLQMHWPLTSSWKDWQRGPLITGAGVETDETDSVEELGVETLDSLDSDSVEILDSVEGVEIEV